MKADLIQARRRTLMEVLYRQHSRALARFLNGRRLGREEAADILQEAYCRMQQVADVESIEYPRAFLFRVANNLALNVAKHRRVAGEQHAVDIDEVELVAEEPGPYRRLRGEQELALARAALQELPPKCRRAFVMHRFENLSYPQIARELNLSVSMIEKYVSQALAHMRMRVAGASPKP
jgi:RNA polymerase sigma-70 factor (ECF subfamily)